MASLSVRAKDQTLMDHMQGTFEQAGVVPGALNSPQLQGFINSMGLSGLQLPFVQESEPLEEAMRRMRSLDRRALVVGYTGPDYRLYMNERILDAYEEDIVQCAELRRFEGATVALFASGSGGGEAGFPGLSPGLFERHYADYALLVEPGAGDLSVYVLTRTDQIAQSILTATIVCRCKKRHKYKQPPPRDGTICNHDKTVIKCV